MKTKLLLFLFGFVTAVSSNSTHSQYKAVERRLDGLEEKMATMFDRISKQLEQKQKILEDQIEQMKSNISLIVNTTRKILEFHVISTCKTQSRSGVYNLQFPAVKAYCDADTFGGGWQVIQQQDHRRLNFTRNWKEYRRGFGIVERYENFWLGLEAIHQLTNGSEDYELLIEMTDHNDQYGFARYAEFRVAGEDDKYRLTVGGFLEGTLEDKFSELNNVKFSTYDSDNDNNPKFNLAIRHESGWWFNVLTNESRDLNSNHGPKWEPWTYSGNYCRMMIRQK